MKMIHRINIYLLILGLNSFLSFGQEINSSTVEIEFGLKIFSYQGNLIGARRSIKIIYVDKFIPQYFNGGFIKFPINKLNFRIGYDYFKYHNQYTLTDLIIVEDFDESVDGHFNQHTIYLGIEKEFFHSIIRPCFFSDLGFHFGRYHGDAEEFLGFSGRKSDYKFDINIMGLGLVTGTGLKIDVKDNILLTFEMAIRINKNFWVKNDPYYRAPNVLIKYNPFHLIGISYKFK